AGAISPDGRLIALIVTEHGTDKLWLRPLDSLSGKELAGTEGARYPFWSPDNRSVAFFAQGKLKRVDIAGGPPGIICDTTSFRGGSWSVAGMILFSPNAGPLQQVPASGGSPRPATTLDSAKGENSHRWPFFLPDGRRFLYFIRNNNESTSGLYMGTLGDEQQKMRLFTSETGAIYTSSPDGGYLLWVRGGHLMAQPFAVSTGQLNGAASVIADRIFTTTNAPSVT